MAIVIVYFGQVISPHHSVCKILAQRSKVFVCVCANLGLQNVFVFVLVFVGQVMSPQHTDQMSYKSQVSRVTL